MWRTPNTSSPSGILFSNVGSWIYHLKAGTSACNNWALTVTSWRMVSASDYPGYFSPGNHKCLSLHLRHHGWCSLCHTHGFPSGRAGTDMPSPAVGMDKEVNQFQNAIGWLLTNARIVLLMPEQKIEPGRWLKETSQTHGNWTGLPSLEYSRDHTHQSRLYVTVPATDSLSLISLYSFHGLKCFCFFTTSLGGVWSLRHSWLSSTDEQCFHI